MDRTAASYFLALHISKRDEWKYEKEGSPQNVSRGLVLFRAHFPFASNNERNWNDLRLLSLLWLLIVAEVPVVWLSSLDTKKLRLLGCDVLLSSRENSSGVVPGLGLVALWSGVRIIIGSMVETRCTFVNRTRCFFNLYLLQLFLWWCFLWGSYQA